MTFKFHFLEAEVFWISAFVFTEISGGETGVFFE